MRNTIIILLLFFVSLCTAQPGGGGEKFELKVLIFSGVADDTIGVITTPDSVYTQFYLEGEWQLLTEVISDGDTAMVTADDKVGENTLHFMLARESYWTHTPQIRFEVRNTGQDTCTSNWINIGKLDGALTLHMVCDTVGSYVDYGNSILTGN